MINCITKFNKSLLVENGSEAANGYDHYNDGHDDGYAAAVEAVAIERLELCGGRALGNAFIAAVSAILDAIAGLGLVNALFADRALKLALGTTAQFVRRVLAMLDSVANLASIHALPTAATELSVATFRTAHFVGMVRAFGLAVTAPLQWDAGHGSGLTGELVSFAGRRLSAC